MRTTPDGTPYPPEEGHGEEGINASPEDVKNGVALAVFFVAVFISVLAVLAGASDGSAVCLPVLLVFGIVFAVIIRLALGASSSYGGVELSSHYEPEPVREVVRIETIHETVKVRCRYCGTLNLVTDTKCQSCGGNL